MGRWTIGRRRYSWERREPIPQAQPATPAANLVASAIAVLGVSYIWLKPVFWIFVGLLGFIAVCGVAVFVLSLWERWSQARQIEPPSDLPEKAISHRPCPYVAGSASTNGDHMNHDIRFALIDVDGDERFAARIGGTFQIGKDKEGTPTDIEKFAYAILVDGLGGRFVCADGRKPAVLKFVGRPRAVVGYRLDPQIATKLGIPPTASR
ncbi:hypothetical protein [Sphingomonas carotinifaciens]|uniref:hypothetical protein n=1 Tax=Sphingomonas carotinifaciens TaxID=1166323 RepID=UPI001F0756B9|nr:hypothetical protein [Sphingomonas carotinifaciens]